LLNDGAGVIYECYGSDNETEPLQPQFSESAYGRAIISDEDPNTEDGSDRLKNFLDAEDDVDIPKIQNH